MSAPMDCVRAWRSIRTDDFTEHAAVADGASNLFGQLFGPEAGHVRVVYGVYGLPIRTPVVVETIFALSSAFAKRLDRDPQYEKIKKGTKTEMKIRSIASVFVTFVSFP
jgi:hypothetical protein